MYMTGIGCVLLCSIILKKTKPFHGPAAPFIMELPQYHIPNFKTVMLHTWERLRGYIVKAGTVLFAACVVMWFLSSYGFVNKENPQARNSGTFGLCSSIIEEAEGDFADPSEYSLMASAGNVIRYIFLPLGFGNEEGGWQAAASTLAGFTAKETIAGTMGVLSHADSDDAESLAEAENISDIEEGNTAVSAIGDFFPSALAAFCFLLFNLLDSPCLAAIATMASELKNRKWFWFAILFQNLFAWCITFIVYQTGAMISGISGSNGASITGFIVAVAMICFILFNVVKPNPYKD